MSNMSESTYPNTNLLLIGNELSLVPIVGDGNCFYRSISYLLSNSQERYGEIRTAVARYVLDHPLEFEGFLYKGQRVQDLVKVILTDKSYGGELEIYAVVRIYKVKIIVHEINAISREYKPDDTSFSQTWHLLYTRRSHDREPHWDCALKHGKAQYIQQKEVMELHKSNFEYVGRRTQSLLKRNKNYLDTPPNKRRTNEVKLRAKNILHIEENSSSGKTPKIANSFADGLQSCDETNIVSKELTNKIIFHPDNGNATKIDTPLDSSTNISLQKLIQKGSCGKINIDNHSSELSIDRCIVSLGVELPAGSLKMSDFIPLSESQCIEASSSQSQIKFICDICKTIFTKKSNLNRHKQRKTCIKKFICGICNVQFPLLINLKIHEKEMKCEGYSSQNVNLTLQTKEVECLTNNSSNASSNVNLTTDTIYLCESQNIGASMSQVDEEIICPLCKKIFYRKSNFEQHKKTNTCIKHFFCKLCCKQFTCLFDLEIHKREMHSTLNTNQVESLTITSSHYGSNLKQKSLIVDAIPFTNTFPAATQTYGKNCLLSQCVEMVDKHIENAINYNSISANCQSGVFHNRLLSTPTEQEIEQVQFQAISSPGKNLFEYQKKLYYKAINNGPSFVCEGCSGLWFKTSLKSFSSEQYSLIPGITLRSLPPTILLCTTCFKLASGNKIPKFSVENGFSFPSLPNVLGKLSPLEQRFVSPRIPFMRITRLGCDKQFGLKGNIVNVPINVESMISVLPRLPNETQTIQIQLMRRMAYKSPYLYETIRPQLIHDAMSHLVNTPLYIKHGVTHSLTKCNFDDGVVDFVADPVDEVQVSLIDSPAVEVHNDVPTETLSDASDANWNEVAENELANCGNNDTVLLSAADFLPEEESIIRFAPGEGQRPISILFDDDAEELSFPCIFAGVKRPLLGSASYGDIVKWELRHSDRRCAVDVTRLFFFIH